MRRLLVVLVVLAAGVLTGCRLDVGVDVAVREDGSGIVAVTAVADADLLAQAPGALADLRLDDVRAAGWTVEGPAAADGGSQRLVLTKPFGTLEQASAVLAEIGSESGPLGRFTFRRDRTDDGTVLWRVRGAAGLPGGAADLSDADLNALLGGVPFGDVDVAAGLGLTVRVQLPVLPAEVTATGASVGDDGVVTFAPSLEGGGISTFTATGTVMDLRPALERESALRSWRWAAVAFAGGLLLLEVGLFARWLRRRRRRRRER